MSGSIVCGGEPQHGAAGEAQVRYAVWSQMARRQEAPGGCPAQLPVGARVVVKCSRKRWCAEQVARCRAQAAWHEDPRMRCAGKCLGTVEVWPGQKPGVSSGSSAEMRGRRVQARVLRRQKVRQAYSGAQPEMLRSFESLNGAETLRAGLPARPRHRQTTPSSRPPDVSSVRQRHPRSA